MPRNTPKLFLLHPGSRKCFWRSKEDRLRLRCGSHRTAVGLPLRMDGWKRNRDWAHGISLEIVPYDLYPFLLSDKACKTRRANNNFICLRSAWNYGRERQQTVPVTTSHIPSASAACLKLYLLLLHLPACGGTWGVAGHLKRSLLSRIRMRGSCDGTSYPAAVGSLSMAPSICDANQPAASAPSALELLAQHFESRYAQAALRY